jgi:anti-sigma factor RsiW
MITCREVVELLHDFVSDELAAKHKFQFDEHLQICSSCVAYAESYRLTIRFARELPRTGLPSDLEMRLRQRFEDMA